MEAPTSPAVPQYLGFCASNNVAVRAPSSRVGVYVQLRGTQEAVRRENPTPRDSVQRMHEERLPNVNSWNGALLSWKYPTLCLLHINNKNRRLLPHAAREFGMSIQRG